MELLHKQLTEKIIGAFYLVYNTLGYGFLERVYENAICIELRRLGLNVERQKQIVVYYEGEAVGVYYADLVIQNLVIVELKASEYIIEEHECQLLNYLRATGMKVGLLLNIGRKAHFKRKVLFSPQNKSV